MNNISIKQDTIYIHVIDKPQKHSPKIIFCGYSTLKQTLPKLTNSPANDIITTITNTLNKTQIQSLIKMHCNKIKRVNANNITIGLTH